MEMPTIEMPKAEARAAFLDYRRAVRERHNAEDEMIMRGYRALSQGHQVVNLLDVMKAAGEDDLHRPRLAFARADQTEVFLQRSSSGASTFCSKVNSYWHSRCPKSEHITIPIGGEQTTITIEGRAIVPNIPPALRPHARLDNYHILWEAEWKRVAPKDPALLKHCGGWLYVVLATWDLTPLEQAVLGLTRN